MKVKKYKLTNKQIELVNRKFNESHSWYDVNVYSIDYIIEQVIQNLPNKSS